MPRLTELHPIKQGLKLRTWSRLGRLNFLTELHPIKQGLKLTVTGANPTTATAYRATSNKTRIETQLAPETYAVVVPPYRATSNKTRIET